MDYQDRAYDEVPDYYYDGGVRGDEGGGGGGTEYEDRTLYVDDEEGDDGVEYESDEESTDFFRADRRSDDGEDDAEPPQPLPQAQHLVQTSPSSEKARIAAAMAPVPPDDPALAAVFPGKESLLMIVMVFRFNLFFPCSRLRLPILRGVLPPLRLAVGPLLRGLFRLRRS